MNEPEASARLIKYNVLILEVGDNPIYGNCGGPRIAAIGIMTTAKISAPKSCLFS